MAKESKVRKEKRKTIGWISFGLSLGLTIVAIIMYAFITIWLFVLGLMHAEAFDETEKSLLVLSSTMGIVILALLFKDLLQYYNKMKEIEKKK